MYLQIAMLSAKLSVNQNFFNELKKNAHVFNIIDITGIDIEIHQTT